MSTPDPGRVQRHDDVAEQDRRVDAVAAHRLQGDLADQLGVRQACSIPVSARSARYSGSERPAWRMNHTGTCAGRPAAGGHQERRVAQVAAGATGSGGGGDGRGRAVIMASIIPRPDRRVV